MFCGSHFYILLFYHSLKAGNPKYDNCWNKKFANFKDLTVNKVGLAVLYAKILGSLDIVFFCLYSI